MTVPSNVKYQDLFLKLQREAREQGKGLRGRYERKPINKTFLGSIQIKNMGGIGTNRRNKYKL